MKQRGIDWIGAGFVFIIAFIVYVITVSPTVAFWDVGEFISCSYNLGVPHPPGTPLYVLIGRLFALIPFLKEPAFRINIISVISAALSAGFVVLIISRVTRSYKSFASKVRENWVPVTAGIIGALFTIFAYSVWENSLEAEVYAPSSLIGLIIVYLAILWKEKQSSRTRTKKLENSGELSDIKADFRDKPAKDEFSNRLMLAVLYIIFLSAGIHLTPVMMLFALIPFILLINHRLLPTFLLGILGLSFILFRFGAVQIFILLFFGIYLLTQVSNSKKKSFTPALFFLASWIVLAVLTFNVLNKTTLPYWTLFIGLALIAISFLYAAKEYKLDMKFFGLGFLILLIALSVQLYLIVRAQHHPSINMQDPTTWARFMSVLHREQYGAPTIDSQLWPRKTVIHPDTGLPTGLSAFSGLLWQFALYGKYFLWQWGINNTFTNLPLLARAGRLLLAFVPIFLGVIGLYSLAKRDRKLFWLLFTAFIVSSAGLVIYLNMRFGHTGPVPDGYTSLPREVRERDYFFTFSYVFYGLFIGFGMYEILRTLKRKLNKSYKAAGGILSGGITLLIIPIALINWPIVTRQHDWIPLEYGYNLLASCSDPSVIFTNGDNDTFPLWFVQEVPSVRYENGEKPYKHGVINANLSLLNTPWYIETLKRKGAPISFVYESNNEKLRFSKGVVPAKNGGLDTLWVGKVAHPSIKKGTLEFSYATKQVQDNKEGKLKIGRETIGEVDYSRGEIIIYNPLDVNYLTVSYKSGEIDNLPPIAISSDGHNRYMLADIMIRDMLATNAGIVYADSEKVEVRLRGFAGHFTKIPLDYLIPVDSFCLKVLERYKEGTMPIYFSTTVLPSKIQNYHRYLIQEGLAYRFRKPPQDMPVSVYSIPPVDIEKSYKMFTQEFQFTSIMDSRVRHSEQTDLLYSHYGIIMLNVAEHMIKYGYDTKETYNFVKPVATFDAEDALRKYYYNRLYTLAKFAGVADDAQIYFDTLKANGWLDANFLIEQAVNSLRIGDTAEAYRQFNELASNATEDNPENFIKIFMFYLREVNDTSKALNLLKTWDTKYPGNLVTIRLYMDYLKDPKNALKVIEKSIQLYPSESSLRILRDSLKRTYNL